MPLSWVVKIVSLMTPIPLLQMRQLWQVAVYSLKKWMVGHGLSHGQVQMD